MAQHEQSSPSSGTGQEKATLNRFGRWVVALNTILGTTQEEMAKRIGYTKGAFSVATRGEGQMNRQTFNELRKAYGELAATLHIHLSYAWQVFLSMAWLGKEEWDADSSTALAADESLAHNEWVADLVKERDRLKKENEKLKEWRYKRDMVAAIQQAEKEKEELQRKVAWLERLQQGNGDS